MDSEAASLPEVQAGRMHPNYPAHPLSLGAKGRMTEEAANVISDQGVPHVEPDQAVVSVAQWALKEIPVFGKERRTLKAEQQRENIFVLDAGTGQLLADLPKRDPGLAKQRPLVIANVLL
jgi:hypothetical protein